MTRAAYAAATALTVVAGLASRRTGMPAWVHAYVGDALYAVMVALALRVPWPVGRWVLPGALGYCFAVELSQLWHPAWLDAVRANRFGALVLGRGFLWSDLIAYAVGVGTVAAAERLLRRR